MFCSGEAMRVVCHFPSFLRLYQILTAFFFVLAPVCCFPASTVDSCFLGGAVVGCLLGISDDGLGLGEGVVPLVSSMLLVGWSMLSPAVASCRCSVSSMVISISGSGISCG